MRRGDLYRVRHPSADPKRSRVFAIVSRQTLVDSRHSTVVCAPVYTVRHGLATEVEVGVAEGLKHASSVHCDALVSVAKTLLTDYVGSLRERETAALNQALRVAMAVE